MVLEELLCKWDEICGKNLAIRNSVGNIASPTRQDTENKPKDRNKLDMRCILPAKTMTTMVSLNSDSSCFTTFDATPNLLLPSAR